ncbi:hypothetical protein SEA_ANNADREAMY_137 [Streptomyces phage Annadreamy]|uniref:Uncharacterized protein n=1 Tax=Streptomyces phage Annadreamy TaxID=2250335 RepID=A0A345GTG0_9CAUD|nr:hypothetical protein HWB75_gp131 [Streptomyces phage Annadreamy]AXG66232.1 hypothetical protein SEA_ANNADREAMY_137 [Streptomyces phage Annadreamy]
MQTVDITLDVNQARLVKRILENHVSSDVKELRRIGDAIHAIEYSVDRLWDEKHDQDAECTCGHVYHRHFDSYEDMYPIGCKYCECDTFEQRV